MTFLHQFRPERPISAKFALSVKHAEKNLNVNNLKGNLSWTICSVLGWKDSHYCYKCSIHRLWKRISRTRGSYIAGKTLIICLKRRGGLFICASWELKWGKRQRHLPQKTSSMNGDKVCWLLVCYFSFDRKLNSCRKYCFAATTVENSDRLLLWKKWGDIFWYKNQDLLSMVDVCDGRADDWAAAVMKTEAKDNGKTIGFRLYVCAQWCWFWDRGEKYVFEKYSMWDSMYSYTLYSSRLYLKNKNCNSCNVDTLTIFVIPVAFIIIAMVIIFLKCLFVLRTNPLIAFYIHFIYTIYILHVSFRGFTGATENKMIWH